ncbi:MAG: hypothetical protein AAB468_03260 [Patescibacteria group bacterium]
MIKDFIFLIITKAQAITGGVSNPSGNPFQILKYDTLSEFVTAILQLAVKIGTPLIVLAIIYCGFLFVTARGNETKIKQAKDVLFATIIGAAIILGAFLISEVIESTIKSLTIQP